MKLNFQNYKSEQGFTLLELLAVIAIMGILASIFIANFNAQRVPRDLNIARNETITNARKVQSYTLSSRDTQGKGNKFYIITFTDESKNYTIGSIDADYNYSLIETVTLPGNVRVDLGEADRCAQVIFAAPFGKTYIQYYFSYNPESFCTDTAKLVDVVSDPITLSGIYGEDLVLTLRDSRRNDLNNFLVKFYGLSGKIDIQ